MCIYMFVYLCLYVCVSVCVYICVYTCVCIYVRVYLCVYMYVCVCLCVCSFSDVISLKSIPRLSELRKDRPDSSFNSTLYILHAHSRYCRFVGGIGIEGISIGGIGIEGIGIGGIGVQRTCRFVGSQSRLAKYPFSSVEQR